MNFVSSGHQADHSGADAERAVWNRLKSAFGPDDVGVAYHRYPIVDRTAGEYDREMDFLLFLRDAGAVVVECKGYQIDHIRAIEGDKWLLRGTSQSSAAPYSQARDQGFKLLSHFTKEPELMDERHNHKVSMNPVVALPNISREEWEARGFHEGPAAPPVLTADDLTPSALRRRVRSLPGEGLTADEYEAARAVLSGGQPISGERSPNLEDGATKAGLYERVRKGLNRLDEKQEEVGLQIPEGPQQVRGIAGSGKTVLMAKKAARMHAAHPEWDVALTFQTRSLYDTITEKVRRYYAFFTSEDAEPDWDKFHVLHGWGGKERQGLYYRIAQEAGVTPRTYGDAREAFDEEDGNLLHSCCLEVLEEGTVQESYDAILIDEAQDFDPGFYKLCRAALRPPKRLIWAYDEAQNLQTLTAPSPTNVFGTDEAGEPVVDLRGTYEGGVQKSQVMRRAYRTPRSVLMLAHALGMGLVRDGGAVQAITTQDGWESIGYEVESGDFRKFGDPVELTRPAEHSPHPLADETAATPFAAFQSFADKGEEVEWVADRVADDIADHGLAPERILVVPLGEYWSSKETGERLADELESRGVTPNLVWEGSKDVFAEDGAVTVSRVNRAKGNQAAMVYVVGVEHVEDDARRADLVQRRNEAFVALTRTEAWCTVTGTGDDEPIFHEIEDINRQVSWFDPALTFPAPHPDDLEREMDDGSRATTIDRFVG
ncbi:MULTISPECIES: NERD domain-containing protein [Halorussus]|uniref:NERD domain-containing protein n=1 Tax=Halorussus TaxID=1070314 RepID=UPI0013B418AE|nr:MULTISPECIES: NERD domain-containing protein [Halorussus]NHN58469.1 ATP-binding domain-containing protein [Halorussus sp. JP-T4]